MTDKEKIKELKRLASVPELTNGFSSQSDCIQWANEVGKLVNYKHYFYQCFSEQADLINTVGLSSSLYKSAINKLNTLINKVITDLEAGYPKQTKKTKMAVLEKPEKVSLGWLWDHVPARFWLYLVGVLFSAFLCGIEFANTNLYKSIIP